jgi:hypothetical protein
VEVCGVGLTYDYTGVSATLADVLSDVGKWGFVWMGDAVLRCPDRFHTLS